MLPRPITTELMAAVAFGAAAAGFSDGHVPVGACWRNVGLAFQQVVIDAAVASFLGRPRPRFMVRGATSSPFVHSSTTSDLQRSDREPGMRTRGGTAAGFRLRSLRMICSARPISRDSSLMFNRGCIEHLQ